MHDLSTRQFSQLSLNEESKSPASPVLPKAGRRLRNTAATKTRYSKLYRIKEFFGFGHPDALPIGVYEGPSGGNTDNRLEMQWPLTFLLLKF